MLKNAWVVLMAAFLLSACASSPPIYNESYKGNYSKVEALLNSGISPDVSLSNGWTPLMIAAAEGHKDVVQLLVNAGANVNASNRFGRTPIMFAARYGFTDIVEILAKAGAKINICPDAVGDHMAMSPLMAAAGHGHTETVQKLILLGADVNLTETDGDSALRFAVQEGHSEAVKILMENGALPSRANKTGVLPLHVAITTNNLSMVNLLLSMGADPNMVSLLKSPPDYMLYKMGVDKEDLRDIQHFNSLSSNLEISPLMAAAQYGNLEIVKALLEKGADIHFKNSTGMTALSYAITSKQKAVEQLLIQAGATE